MPMTGPHSGDDNAGHLAHIDAEAWPGVASPPRVHAGTLRARRVEASFARALAKAGIVLDGENAPLAVHHEAVFGRIAAGGWIGLAEGYLAGEWTTPSSDQLVDVLAGLISSKFHPRTPSIAPAAGASELPPALVTHFSGDGASPFQGHFGTGVPTTQRNLVKSHVRGAGRNHVPAKLFVDVTEYADPLDAERTDLGAAQTRTMSMLLDAAHVGAGTHLLIRPAAGAALAVAASKRGATVDCLVDTEETGAHLRENLVFAGASDAVRVETSLEGAAYDAVVSAEHLETLPEKAKVAYLRALDAALAPGGTAAVQTIVRTEAFTPAATGAVASLRAYVWPGFCLSTPQDIAKLTDRHTRLRIVGQSHAPTHLAQSLRLQRHTFEANARDAAADGFDAVYRRLWVWQLALREALTRQGLLDLVQLRLVPRSRGGRR